MRCMDRAALESMLGEGLSLAEIGRRVGRHEATVSYWLKKYGLGANNQAKHVARGGIERAHLEELVAAGRSIAEIAEAVDRSKATVRHWLMRFGLRTKNGAGRRRTAASASARREGLTEAAMVCARHGVTRF